MNLKIVRITKNIPNLLFFVNADAWLTLLSQEVSGMVCFKTFGHYIVIYVCRVAFFSTLRSKLLHSDAEGSCFYQHAQ